MNRRELLKVLGIGASIGATASPAFALNSNAHNWIFIHAGGGWDPTSQWDPKGKEIESFGGPVNKYSQNDIRQIGNIRYAPVPDGVDTQDQLHTFTQKYYKKMMVINGIDQGTNSHGVGARACMSGDLGKGVPAMAALIAAPFASEQSMAFIHSGGYDNTSGLLSPAKLLSAKDYERLATPDKFLDSDNVLNLLREKKQLQLTNSISNAQTDRGLLALQRLQSARDSSGELNTLLESIPGELNSNSKKAAAEIAAAAFKTGSATTASFNVGGFDSHGNNDQDQFDSIDELLSLIDYIWQQLELQGVDENTTLVVGSDMGRKPYYSGNGKGHWPISSMLMMGKGIKGNQTIGSTDNDLKSIKVNPLTLQPDPNGININTPSIFEGLRRVAGITGSILDSRFPINGEYMAIFD